MKYIIVGGVAGGATAAARIRRIDEKNDIILLEKGDYISYANCGLPYYIGGVIKEREKLFVQTPNSFGIRFNVDVRVKSEVVKIDREKKEVAIKIQKKTPDGVTYSQYTEKYDKLLLSPGASPVRPPFPGIDSNGIFTLRNVNDTDAIKSYLTENKVGNAVIVGAGFIGLEMAENLQEAGVHVSIVEMADQVMTPIDFSMAQIVHQHLTQKGVDLYLKEAVASFTQLSNHKLAVNLQSGKMIPADMVILSIGVRPNTVLAKEAGLELGEAGGIKVNEYLQTSDPDIYAVGDAIEYPHPLTGKGWLNYLAVPANRQGRIVADNMVKKNSTRYEGAIGTSIAKVFDLTVATTGLPAKRLVQAGVEFTSSTTHSMSNAGYYPGALPLTIKITFNPKNGKLLGGQIVGYQGVDKRIDEIALVIKTGGTIYQLIELEHAYAPPFSSAKDPVAIAGYVAGNIIEGAVKPVYWRELKNMLDKKEADAGFTLLDVRTKAEFEMGHIEGAVNIPLDELRDIVADCDLNGGCDLPTKYAQILHPDREIVTTCAIGLRGYLAYRMLIQSGYKNVRNLVGGYKTYSTATAEITMGPQGGNGSLGKDEDMEKGISGSNEKQQSGQISDGADGQSSAGAVKTVVVDACGLQCPGPVLKLKKSMDMLAAGERVEVISTDMGFMRDAGAWCKSTGNILLSQKDNGGKFTVVIEKGAQEPVQAGAVCGITRPYEHKSKTFIMFSDDLDKALATFVLANGAAATGGKVTIFFTFWGLNVIKKQQKPAVKKDIFGKMFGMMLPASSLQLKLSKMSMAGIGGRMMRHIMKIRGIDSLESLRTQALENGVEFIACQMSMDVMGVATEELLDEVTIGGVATYMERADQANVNLFI
ncbi:MAG: FAD-dependent oxidoreductase [Bacteroidales bacterium]